MVKNNYYWNDYRREGDTVIKYKCNKFKSFDGKENTWKNEESKVESWTIDDSAMPEWLHKYL